MWTLALAALLAPLAPQQGFQRPDVVSGMLGHRLDREVRDLAPKMWGSVLVTVEGRPVLAKGYGLADRSRRANGQNTLLDVCGVSRTFTAAAVMLLSTDHRLELDDRIHLHLPDVPLDKHDVRVRHLLNHTSGLDQGALPRDGARTRELCIAAVLGAPLVAEPGELYQDGDADDVLLAAVIEFSSGRTFEQFLKRDLFRRIGMNDTRFVGDPIHNPAQASRRIYRKDGVIHDGTVFDGEWDWSRKGAGGVVTSAWDLHLWARALDGDRLFDEKRRKLLFEPVLGGYAMGWHVEELAGLKHARQGGRGDGYRACMAWHPGDAVSVAVVSDHADVERIERSLSNLALASVRGFDVELLESLEGLYTIDGSNRFQVVVEEYVLSLVPEGREATALLAHGDLVLPEDPELLDQIEQEGIADLARLASRDEVLARPAFASTEATRAALAVWNAAIEQHGAHHGFEWIGSDAADAPVGFARSLHERGSALLRLTWNAERRLTSVELWSGELPRRVAFTPISPDELAARNLSGTGELVLRFLPDEEALEADPEAEAPPTGLVLVARFDSEEDEELPPVPIPSEAEGDEEEEEEQDPGLEVRALRVVVEDEGENDDGEAPR